jgi:hypothetical protein
MPSKRIKLNLVAMPKADTFRQEIVQKILRITVVMCHIWSISLPNAET